MPHDEQQGARRLDAARILTTVERARQRIEERFPQAGLVRVARDLAAVAQGAGDTAERLGRPYLLLRVAMVGAVIGLGVVLAPVLRLVDFEKTAADNIYTAVQGIDATLQIVGVTGAVLFFLITLEDRLKRRRALRALHELRSVIHVIDMHQLTKDPSVGDEPEAVATASSPERAMTTFELKRYLDYCSELLSLSSKVAALYAQSLPDDVVTDAVSDLERLTTNLSQKIWQKIALLHEEKR